MRRADEEVPLLGALHPHQLTTAPASEDDFINLTFPHRHRRIPFECVIQIFALVV
jgi:hypothetical protein